MQGFSAPSAVGVSTAGPVQRTMEWLRSQGYVVDKVERRLPRGWTTVDCFGFADILALHPDFTGVLAVQATTNAHVAERITKVRDVEASVLWLKCGNRLWVVGWALRARGTAKNRSQWARDDSPRSFPKTPRKVWVPKVVELAG